MMSKLEMELMGSGLTFNIFVWVWNKRRPSNSIQKDVHHKLPQINLDCDPTDVKSLFNKKNTRISNIMT